MCRSTPRGAPPSSRAARRCRSRRLWWRRGRWSTSSGSRVRRTRASTTCGRFGNSDAIRGRGERGEHVVLIGGSYIGTEVAASLTATGTRCTIVPAWRRWLLVADLRGGGGEAGSTKLLDSQKGVDSARRRGAGGDSKATARSETVVTKSGLTVECDAVIVGAGVRPGRDAGRAGRTSRSTTESSATPSFEMAVPGIYAAGDCCSYDSVVHGAQAARRALGRGNAAGHRTPPGNMLGDERDYDVVPYFFSDLADWASPSVRRARPTSGTRTIWRGDRRIRRVLGLVPAGRGGSRERSASSSSEDLAEARRMLVDGVDVSEAREALADPDIELARIL